MMMRMMMMILTTEFEKVIEKRIKVTVYYRPWLVGNDRNYLRGWSPRPVRLEWHTLWEQV